MICPACKEEHGCTNVSLTKEYHTCEFCHAVFDDSGRILVPAPGAS